MTTIKTKNVSGFNDKTLANLAETAKIEGLPAKLIKMREDLNNGFSQEMVDAGIQKRIEDGSLASMTIGDNSITGNKIADGTIPLNKLQNCEASYINLLDGIALISSKQLNGTGGLTSYNAENRISTEDYIKVEPSTTYSFKSNASSFSAFIRACTYDESKNFIAYYDSSKIVTTEGNAKYVRITYPNDATEVIFAKGSSIPDELYYTLSNVKTDGEIKLEEEVKNIKQTISSISPSGDDIVIDCWGDSLTAGSGASVSGGYVTVLRDTYGLNVNNYGVGGETPNEIAARQGGMPMIVNGFTIPTTTTSVDVGTITNIDGTSLVPVHQHGVDGRSINPCYIAGVKGSLAYDTSNSIYTFTRAEEGNKVVIDRPTFIKTDAMINNRNNIMIIWMGTNGYSTNADYTIRIVKQMIAYNKLKEFIILSPPTGKDATQSDAEAKYLEEFGSRYINIRRYLVEYGLSDNGLTATDDDKSQIKLGYTPTQLRIDATHYNQYGYNSIAKAIYNRLRDLGVI